MLSPRAPSPRRPLAAPIPPAWRRALRPVVGTLAVLSLLACDGDEPKGPGGKDGGSAPRDAISVRVVPVAVERIAQAYNTSTTLQAEQQATVIARTTGVVKRLAVEEGAVVSAGQTLAQLEDDEARITLARAQLTREARDREHARQQALRAQDLTSDVELELSRAQAEDAAQALLLAELEMARTTIRAPFSGVVLRRHLDVGASVSNGTAMYDIADLDPLIAEVHIPERHVASLKADQQARLYADASAAMVDGKILRIAPFVDPASGTVKVTVAASAGAELRPGAFVKVDIVTQVHESALVVPRPALVAEGRRWHVYVLADDKKTVQQREVSLGFEEGERVELLPPTPGAEPSVSAGELVVYVGAPALSEGAEVDVAPAEAVETQGAP